VRARLPHADRRHYGRLRPTPAALEREAIDARAVDLWSPLLAIAFVADMEDGGDRSREVPDAARDAGSQREAGASAVLERGPTAVVMRAGRRPTR
jgi:hypothetical protein